MSAANEEYPRRTGSQSVFAKIASQGPQTFSAPPPKEAFEVWWGNEFGNRMRGSKYVARRAWYAALREMGCFEDTANAQVELQEGSVAE